MNIQKNAIMLKQPEKLTTPSLKFFSFKPGPAVPGGCNVLGDVRRDVRFGSVDFSVVNRFGGAITKGDGIAVVAVFDNKQGDLKARTVPDLFNDKELKGKIAPYSKLGKYFYDDAFWKAGENSDILYKASPIVTSTMGMLSAKPLDSLETNGKGNVIIEGEYYGKTRYVGPTLDQLIKAGIKVNVEGVFLATETGYAIVDANQNGNSYTIKSILKPEEIKTSLLAFYGNFENGQMRKTDNPFVIPVGDLA